MLLKNIFPLLLLLLLAVCAIGYTPTVAEFSGIGFSSDSAMGAAMQAAIALGTTRIRRAMRRPMQPGEVVEAAGIFNDVVATVMFKMSSTGFFTGGAPGSLRYDQFVNGVFSLNPTGGDVYENGIIYFKDAAGCLMGMLSYVITVRSRARDELKKRSLEEGFSNSTFSTGIHYVPQNGTTHINYPVRLPPHNGTPLCKRHDTPMAQCYAPGTIISGAGLVSGNRIYAGVGHYAELQKDGNLCTTDYYGKKYWCAMSQDSRGGIGKNGPYHLEVDHSGFVRFYDKRHNPYHDIAGYRDSKGDPINDEFYRLVMQNDGNLVMYRGTDQSQPIWTSQTRSLYKYKVPNTCGSRRVM